MSSLEIFFEIQTAADVIVMIQQCVSFTQSETMKQQLSDGARTNKKEILGQCQGC